MTRARRAGRAGLVFVTLVVVGAQALASGLVRPARAQAPGPLAAPCPALGGTFNRWTRVETPRRPELAHVGSFAQDPCTFVGATADGGVYRATDARTWSPAVDLGLDDVSGIATEDMPVGTAFVFGVPRSGLLEDGADPRATGLYVTRDFGVSFQDVPDLAGYSVSAVAAAPSDPQVMYATASPTRGAPVPLVLKSADFGRTWIPLPGSLPALPTRVAVDARLPGVVWTNAAVGGAPSSGVWRSLNGGISFERVRDDVVVDFDTSPVPGGGSRVDMATPSGLVRTRDTGTTFRDVTQEPVAAVTHETYAPAALMVVSGGKALRSTTSGSRFKQTPGLGDLTGCTVSALTRNEEFPSNFLLSLADCAAAGHYLYRSDGRDLANVEDIGGDVDGGYMPRLERLPRTEMRVLRDIELPVRGTNPSSDSLAFDGQHLYYTNNDAPRYVYVSTTEGRLVRTLTVEDAVWLRTLTYDPHLDVLWAVGTTAGAYPYTPQLPTYVFQIDPVTGASRQMFRSPLDSTTGLSMDPTEQVFRSYSHHGYTVYEVSMTGQIVDECEVPGWPVDPNLSTNPDRGHPESTAPGFASGVAAGGGRMYLQLEDDRTIYHVSEDCELLSVFEHRRFAESGGNAPENDQLACDTVTFGQPAIWIRDADTNHAIAYAVPSGYCPLDSKITLTPPTVTAKAGAAARACALLQGRGPGGSTLPVPGAELTFYAGDVPVATGLTDEDGFACASFDAPGPPARTVPLEVAFFGSVSFRASSAAGILDTFTPLTPDPKKPLPPPPPPPRAPQVVVVPPPPPPLIQLPAAGGARLPQPPQGPQAQPQQQPQAQAQAGFARQQQQQTQLALAFAADETPELTEEFAMSERRERNLRLSLQGAAALVVFAFGWCMTRTSVAYRKVRR